MQHKVFIPVGLTVNHPFFYIIQHIPSGKYYAGYCSSKRHCDSETFMTEDGYKTSSKLVEKIILNEGVNVFHIRRVKHFNCSTLALEYESKFLSKINARKNEMFINRSNGSKDFDSNKIPSLETCKRRSEALSGSVFWNNGSINTSSKEKPSGDDWVLGILMTPEQRKVNSEKSKGRKCWNNGKIEKMFKGLPPTTEWVRGRLKSRSINPQSLQVSQEDSST